MPDPTPSPAPVADDRAFRSLRRLTYISLGLNVLILLLFVGGAMHHHKREKEHRWGMRGGGQQGCPFFAHGQRGGGPGCHRFQGNFSQGPGQMWGGRGGWRQGPGGGMGFRQRGPGGPGGGPSFGGGPGFGGPRGMMGGTPPDPARMTDGILAMLSGKLNLTDDQKAKLKPIIQDQVTQFQKDMEAQRDAMQKKIEDAKAKIKPILNADQQKQLDALPIPGQKPAAPPAPADKK